MDALFPDIIVNLVSRGKEFPFFMALACSSSTTKHSESWMEARERLSGSVDVHVSCNNGV